MTSSPPLRHWCQQQEKKRWHFHATLALFPLPEKKEGNPTTGCRGRELKDVRVLVDKLGAVVDLVVDHDKEVLLGVVLGNILVRVLGRHGGRIGLNASKLFKERSKE